MIELARYLERIGYDGDVEPTLEVLRLVHRRHLFAISYENIDVQLRRPLDLDIDRIFHKIVDSRRGGWCYEMNGLLGWALGQIGFDVTRLLGGVMRLDRGDQAFGNHLVLAVQLDEQTWIADVGLGDGLEEPIPLEEGTFHQSGKVFRLEALQGDEWRFHNRDGGSPPSFDLIVRPADEARLEASCDELQNHPESMFRLNLVCQRLRDHGTDLLLGRVLRRLHSTGSEPRQKRTLIDSPSELRDVLDQVFDLDTSSFENEITSLWQQVLARHETLFGDTPVEEIQFG